MPQVSPLQRHGSLSKLKPYLAAQGLAGRSSESVFFLMVCQVERHMAVSEVPRFHDALLCDGARTAVSIISPPYISLNLSDPN